MRRDLDLDAGFFFVAVGVTPSRVAAEEVSESVLESSVDDEADDDEEEYQ